MFQKREKKKILVNIDNNTSENEDENNDSQKKEENALREQNDNKELNQKRINKLKSIFYKKDRKIIIFKKNNLQKWNLRAKIISLGPKKKLRSRSKKKGDSKKKDSKKGKKVTNIIKKKINGENVSEDERDKEDEKEE